jgi:hypothetical protein
MVHYLGQAAVIPILDGWALCGRVAIVVLIAIVLAGSILALAVVFNFCLPVVNLIGPPC